MNGAKEKKNEQKKLAKTRATGTKRKCQCFCSTAARRADAVTTCLKCSINKVWLLSELIRAYRVFVFRKWVGDLRRQQNASAGDFSSSLFLSSTLLATNRELCLRLE